MSKGKSLLLIEKHPSWLITKFFLAGVHLSSWRRFLGALESFKIVVFLSIYHFLSFLKAVGPMTKEVPSRVPRIETVY